MDEFSRQKLIGTIIVLSGFLDQIPGQFEINPGHGTHRVDSGTVPANPGRLAALEYLDVNILLGWKIARHTVIPSCLQKPVFVCLFVCMCSIVHLFLRPLNLSTQRRSRLQSGHCIGVSRWSARAIASEGPYEANWGGFEPRTFRLQGNDATTTPLRLTM